MDWARHLMYFGAVPSPASLYASYNGPWPASGNNRTARATGCRGKVANFLLPTELAGVHPFIMHPTDRDCGREGHELELRVVALLEEAAKLVERANGVQRTEDKREAVLQGRAMAETVRKLRDDIHCFIKRAPRCDFPRHDTTLLKRYLSVLDQ